MSEIPTDISPQPSTPVQYRFLSPAEWARVAQGIGATREGDETHRVVHPTCWFWPPKGMPEGLYRDVVKQRAKYHLLYSIVSTVRWFLMILQLVIGAGLTALGSLDARLSSSTPITVLAAVNTVGAGLLALLHNSGLPDRYRMDNAEFAMVESFLKELIDTAVVEAHQTTQDVLNECYTRFQNAQATVWANKPEAYWSPTKAKPTTTTTTTTIAANAPELVAVKDKKTVV
ncbi:SMODS and SLOG-associating 2TM effector domain-containing protein [Madurella fahalii]|uniref:SMODS and SLOG-associating 2TM effector domain-containing protein n=1 Tax=Madurella fahalii TaxID=1157608 RepID=A0ABQ0GFX5_9PEZI